MTAMLGRFPHYRAFMRCRRGGSAVQFAMVFPLMIILMFGIICIGQAFYAMAGSQWAVERALRDMMVDRNATHDDVEAEIAALLPGLSALDVEVSFSDEDSGTIPETRVLAQFAYPIRVPFITSFRVRYRLETTAVRPF